MKSKNFSPIILIICMVSLAMTLTASPAFALPTSPTVDGNVQYSEGYTSSFNVSFDVKNGLTGVPGGTLYTAYDDDKLYYGLILPRSIAENTYEPTNQEYIDKYGKDELEFKLKYKDGPEENEIKLKLDYIDDALNASVREFKWKSKVYLDDGSTQSEEVRFDEYVDFNSSLDYNLNGDEDWISDIMYEFSIDKLAFNGYDIGVDIGDFINLDNLKKIKVESTELGDKDIYPAARVPEPATMLLLGAGLLGLAGFGRKKLFRK